VSGAGWLSWHSPEATGLAPRQLIFPRSGFVVRAEFSDLPETDRITALLALIRPLGPVAALRCEYADTNEGRSLERFLKRFRGALARALEAEKLLGNAQCPTLHLFFHDSRNGVIGLSSPGTASDWENGIPRLRLPAAAPSRSAQKLEEAWLRLMTPAERTFWLRDGRTGADLGAAPGGWTWQLARHGVRMTAVDHGKLAPALLAEWLAHDGARLARFNLKLPMKQRFATVQALLERLDKALDGRGMTIRATQLYYDREEITVLVVPREQPGG